MIIKILLNYKATYSWRNRCVNW